ncbi:MAG: histidine kinase [Sideroxyarcus sp.]|nr:histidine kinase [Sideroxyarcus sp.]
MFKYLRFYSIASFVVIFITAALLALFYRQVTLHWIDHLAKANNLTVAQTALNFIGPELAAHLGRADMPVLSGEMEAKIRSMTQTSPVVRIEIYDRSGRRVFPSGASSPASDPGSTPDFQAALGGNVSEPSDMQDTYIPIRGTPAEPVMGVFGIHSDMSHLIEESDRMLLLMLAGVELILALLYAALVFVVRHADNALVKQQKPLRERATSLEILSTLLLKGDEVKRKKIAAELHEGLAQTLSAIKVNVESSELAQSSRSKTPATESLVPVLQQAIQEVRSIATELHPSSLEDLGLLPTLNWYCREFENAHPDIRVRNAVSLSERTIPEPLKIVIFRITESAFNNIAQYSDTDQIRLVLHQSDDMIHLIIGDTPTTRTGTAQTDSDADAQFRFAEIQERTALSGGVFSNTREKSGGVTLRASWPCAGTSPAPAMQARTCVQGVG